MGGVNGPDLAAGLADAVARLRELAGMCESLDTGDGVLETPLEQAREIGVDLRLVLAFVSPTAPEATEDDELAHVQVGDPDPTGIGDCPARLGDGPPWCTRPAGHPGQHIAGGGSTGVVAVWPPRTPGEQGTAEAESDGHSIRDRLAGDEGLTGDEELAVGPDAARCPPDGDG